MLTYKQMQEGTVILSAIRQVTNLSLQIEFTGLTFGHVPITSISDELNEYMSNHMDDIDTNDPMLKNMFPIGSFVPAKLTKLDGLKVVASINPTDINANRRHSSFKKGMLMWACIQSKLDHGYQASNGVSNCTIFLPKKNIDEGKTYRIGQPLWCVIHKCNQSQSTSILTVSAKWEHIIKVKQEDLDSLHNLIPGTQVELFVDKVTRNGIEGKFINDYPGYVNETQLAKPLHSLAKVKEGRLLNAYVLYTQPVTNITHLSLRSLATVPQPTYNVGHIMAAEVITKSPRGLFLKLNNEEKGFITNRRLLKTLPTNADTDLANAIKKKYPPGCKRQCRIMDFNHMERMYICTFETEIVKEKFFTSNDLTVGELVTGTVEESKHDGLVISVGHVRGFVPNLHISDTSYSDNIKKKFTVGSQVAARLWNITEQGNTAFTMKQALVKSEVCLKDIEHVKSDEMYPGVVIQSKESGALVAFYGGIMGWISTRQLTNDQGFHVDPRKFFYRGQVVSFRSLGVKNGRLQLSSKVPTRKRKNSEQDSSLESIQKTGNQKKKKKTSSENTEGTKKKNMAEVKNKKTSNENSEVNKKKSIVEAKDSKLPEAEDSVLSEAEDSSDEKLMETDIKSVMPGVEDFFTIGKTRHEQDESSSSDDEAEVEKVDKKKKLTSLERAKLEQEKLRKIQEELTESRTNPQCAEHFESILMDNPNSYDWWLKYIAFHVSYMELDKARAVAKRALETIDMTLCEEKLNVWTAYLNLENMFGTKDSFEEVFEEALRLNDSMAVYLKAIEILAEAGKMSEAEEKIKKAKNKFKTNPVMWETIGKVYYLMKNFKEARNCKNLAIRSIQDKKAQLNLIVRFAIMEFRYGEMDAGSAIFETILQSDPRKVTIWITYVDQLVKIGSIDLARGVLERSVGQKLPARAMKSLFKKFITFEEQHGTTESVNEVKRKIAEHVARCQA